MIKSLRNSQFSKYTKCNLRQLICPPTVVWSIWSLNCTSSKKILAMGLHIMEIFLRYLKLQQG